MSTGGWVVTAVVVIATVIALICLMTEGVPRFRFSRGMNDGAAKDQEDKNERTPKNFRFEDSRPSAQEAMLWHLNEKTNADNIFSRHKRNKKNKDVWDYLSSLSLSELAQRKDHAQSRYTDLSRQACIHQDGTPVGACIPWAEERDLISAVMYEKAKQQEREAIANLYPPTGKSPNE